MGKSQGGTGFGTIVKLGDGGTKADSTVGSGNAAFDITAQDAGTDGNSITFEIDTSSAATEISVTVVGTAITLVPVGAVGTPTSTASDCVKALLASPEAWVLIKPILSSGSDGSGAVSTYTATALTGGVDEVFTPIMEIKDVTPGNFTTETADATHNESPGGYREVKATFKDAGELSFSGNFLVDSPNHENLYDIFEAREEANFQIAWSTSAIDTVWKMGGLIQGLAPSAPMADMVTWEVTIKISGAVDRQAGL